MGGWVGKATYPVLWIIALFTFTADPGADLR